MNAPSSPAPPGRVASLHLHPTESGQPLQNIDAIEVVESKGVLNDPRYFGRISQKTDRPNRRQVSLMEREQIAEHAAVLGLPAIAPGAVRANIETSGVNLVAAIGHQIRIGEAVLFLYEARLPCQQMDAICAGLRQLMENSRQGVMAEVVQSGKIRVGDTISIVSAAH